MLTTTEYGKLHHLTRPTVIKRLKAGAIVGHLVENRFGVKEWRIPESEIKNECCPNCGYVLPSHPSGGN
jgi:hypothetical protein